MGGFLGAKGGVQFKRSCLEFLGLKGSCASLYNYEIFPIAIRFSRHVFMVMVEFTTVTVPVSSKTRLQRCETHRAHQTTSDGNSDDKSLQDVLTDEQNSIPYTNAYTCIHVMYDMYVHVCHVCICKIHINSCCHPALKRIVQFQCFRFSVFLEILQFLGLLTPGWL